MSDDQPHIHVASRGMVTLSLMLATVMQVLDSTIANVALPHMQGSLNAGLDTVTWVLTSYIVAAAVAIPLTGWLADRFGRKQLYLGSIVLFTVASILCGMADSLGEMVLYRVFQGFGGAALVPLAQAIMLDIYPRSRHASAMAIWGAGIMLGPILGPTLGGWLTDILDWRWVFYINVPIGILAFAGIWVFLPHLAPQRRRFDIIGFALLALGIGILQIMLDRGQHLDWFSSTEIVIEAAIATACLWMFGVHLRQARDPLVDRAIFRDRNFVTGLVFAFIAGVLLFATMVLLPPMLQNLMNYPAMITGFVLAPRGFGTMVAMIAAGRLANRVSPKLLMLIGLLATAQSLHEMTRFSLDMGPWPVVWTGIVQGLGLGLVFSALISITFATLDPRVRTDGAAIFSLIRNIGTSMGISLVATLLARNSQINQSQLGEHITAFSWGVDPSLAALIANSGGVTALAMIDAEITRQATMIGILNDFKLMMILTLACIPLIFAIRTPRTKAADGAAIAAE